MALDLKRINLLQNDITTMVCFLFKYYRVPFSMQNTCKRVFRVRAYASKLIIVCNKKGSTRNYCKAMRAFGGYEKSEEDHRNSHVITKYFHILQKRVYLYYSPCLTFIFSDGCSSRRCNDSMFFSIIISYD